MSLSMETEAALRNEGYEPCAHCHAWGKGPCVCVESVRAAHTARLAALDAEIAEAEKEAQEMMLPSISMPLKHRLAGLRRARAIITGATP